MLITNAHRSFSEGVQVFLPEDAQAYAKAEPTKGFGIIRYNEGSVYYGDVYFDGKKYEKLGFGRQDFMLSEIGAWIPEHGVRKAFYIGAFDYRETEWIYGNGIMFFVDENNRPACFVKGFYEGIDLVGPYTGELTPDMLPDGYTMDMERQFDGWGDTFHRQMAKLSRVEELENLFIGDSYFDYWDNEEYAGDWLFETLFPTEKNLNLGNGGTCFHIWMRFMDQVTGLPQPKRIFINLGFNDLHRNRTPERVYGCYLEFLQALKMAFPQSEYYLLNVVQSVNHVAFAQMEEQLNAMIRQSAQELGVRILDMRGTIEACGGRACAFHPDGIHYNALGYEQMGKKILEIIT